MPAHSSALADNRAEDRAAARVCRACGGTDIAELLPERSVPVYCNVLWQTRAQAIDAPRGRLRLTRCGGCGHVSNHAFDADLLDYTPAYENSLHHSPHFNRYAVDLARRLVDTYDLRGKFVVDVGCGRGDFLTLLCRLGGNRGRGYDRSYPPDAAALAEGLDVGFVPQFFSSAQSIDADRPALLPSGSRAHRRSGGLHRRDRRVAGGHGGHDRCSSRCRTQPTRSRAMASGT